jgi:hypothetical protein
VWANFSILYGLVEFGNRSAAADADNAAAHESVRRAYRIYWQTAKIKRHDSKPKFCDEVYSWVKTDMKAGVTLAQQSHFSLSD